MHQGTIRQVGTPTQVYHDPSEVFVARFLGEINTIAGTVTEQTGSDTRVTAGPLSVTSARPCGFRPGDAVVCAIRPEDVLVGPVALPLVQGKAQVEAVIFQGSREQIIFRHEFGPIVAERGTQHGFVAEGDVVSFGWDPFDVRLLDPVDDA